MRPRDLWGDAPVKHSINRALIRATCAALAVSAVLAVSMLVSPTAAATHDGSSCTSGEEVEIHGVARYWRGNCVVLDTAIIHVADGTTMAQAIEGLSSLEGWELDRTIDALRVIVAKRGGVIVVYNELFGLNLEDDAREASSPE